MAVIKVYTRINWLNKLESLTTPLGKTNLNKMDKAINLIDDEVVSMSAKIDEIDTTKVSADQLNNMVTDVSFNDKNGVISITKHNGTVLNIDTAMEKIAVNFEYNAQTQQLILTLENGEKQYIDMSALITQYEFKDTDTIAFSVDSDGKVSASIKSGSITKAMLSSEVMSAITLSENNAAASAQAAAQSATNADMDAKLSQSYSVGKSGIRDGEDTDNSKYYSEQAKKYADEAQEIAGGNFIPNSEKGIAGGVAVLDANLAVAKAVADEDGNNIKESLKGKSDSNHTHPYAGSNTAGGIANSSNLVYATSHQGEWYQNSQWDGTYFQTNYKHGDDVLPMRVGYSGYSDNSGKVNNHTVSSDVPANAKFTDTTYSDATTSAHGLMSTSDKSKLNGIAAGANKTTILNSLAATTTGYALDAIQGKALNDKITAINDSLAHMAWQNVGSNLFVETDTTYVSYNTLQAYILTGYRLVDFAIVFTTKQALTKGTDYYFCKLTYTPDDVPYNYLVYYDNNAAVLTVKTNGNVFLRPLTADIPVNYTLNARGIFKN